ncbi:uncharacterized protein AAES06_018591 [Glossophaga mutica]
MVSVKLPVRRRQIPGWEETSEVTGQQGKRTYPGNPSGSWLRPPLFTSTCWPGALRAAGHRSRASSCGNRRRAAFLPVASGACWTGVPGSRGLRRLHRLLQVVGVCSCLQVGVRRGKPQPHQNSCAGAGGKLTVRPCQSCMACSSSRSGSQASRAPKPRRWPRPGGTRAGTQGPFKRPGQPRSTRPGPRLVTEVAEEGHFGGSHLPAGVTQGED